MHRARPEPARSDTTGLPQGLRGACALARWLRRPAEGGVGSERERPVHGEICEPLRIAHTGFGYSNAIVEEAAQEILALLGFEGERGSLPFARDLAHELLGVVVPLAACDPDLRAAVSVYGHGDAATAAAELEAVGLLG